MPEASSCSLLIRCFGPFDVLINGMPMAKLRTRKDRLLLAYLVLHYGREVDRDEIVEALWCESERSAGRYNLCKGLADLRKALGGFGTTHLKSIGKQRLRLDLTAAEADIIAFDNASQRTDEAALEIMLSIYSAPLLKDWGNDDAEQWILPERDRRRRQYIRALQHHYQAAIDENKTGQALEVLKHLANLDIVEETHWQRLIQSQIRQGAHQAAIVSFQTLEAHLLRVHGLEPSRESRNLYRMIPAERRPETDRKSAWKGGLSVPVPLTRFFGRETELEQIRQKICDRNTRLVTVTGPGGIGKSRLAIEVVSLLSPRFMRNTWFVSLAEYKDANALVPALIKTLQIKSSTDGEPFAEIVAFLTNKRPATLLILDNLEHLVDASVPILQDLLQCVPALTCLVTSRRSLGLAGECVIEVLPLPVPQGQHTVETLMHIPSVRLFVDRVREARPAFELSEDDSKAVAALCCRLEGIPLSLVLAASWAGVRTPAQLLTDVEQNVISLVDWRRQVTTRHRSLQAALQWSCDLLSPDLQHLFACLSVFHGGWAREAAEAVCRHPDTLCGLAELRAHSLIETEDRNREMRFKMLQSIREFAQEQLSDEERTQIRQRHAAWVLQLAQETAHHYNAPDQLVWLEQLESEHSNVCAALEWYRDSSNRCSDSVRQGLELASALVNPWAVKGRRRELQGYVKDLLARVPENERHMKWYVDVAAASVDITDGVAVYEPLENAIRFYREIGNTIALGMALGMLGWVKHEQQDYLAALGLFSEAASLVNYQTEAPLYGRLINAQSIANFRLGNFAEARRCAEEAVLRQREVRNDGGIMQSLFTLGMIMRALKDCAAAEAAYDEGLAIARRLNHHGGSVYGLEGRACLEVEQGNHARAACLMGCADALRARMETPKPESEREEYDGYVTLARNRLSKRDFARAWQAGHDAPWKDVISFAVREIPDSALLGMPTH